MRTRRELVRRIRFLAAAAELVLSHHERFDGKGYPRGLSGGEIPLDARIFAVADTLDAMTSDRPYRKGVSADIAFTELEKQRGKQFDPACADAFLAIRGRILQEMKEPGTATLPARDLRAMLA